MELKPFISPGLVYKPEQKNSAVEETTNISLELSLSREYMSTSLDSSMGKFQANENRKFIFYDFLSSVKNFIEPVKKVSDVEETTDISLELSLSCNYMQISTDPGEKLQVSESKENKNCKKEISLEGSNTESLEFSLSGASSKKNHATCSENHKGSEKSECSFNNQFQNREEHNLMIKNDHKKLKLNSKAKVENLSLQLSVNGNKRRKVEKNQRSEVVVPELRPVVAIANHQNPWTIKKKLTKSDVSNTSRLMLSSEDVKFHIFPFWNADQFSKIKDGVPVLIWDCDTRTEQTLHFKQWNERANVLMKNWSKDFVKRRELKENDEIGLYWDRDNSSFKFSVLTRAPTN